MFYALLQATSATAAAASVSTATAVSRSTPPTMKDVFTVCVLPSTVTTVSSDLMLLLVSYSMDLLQEKDELQKHVQLRTLYFLVELALSRSKNPAVIHSW